METKEEVKWINHIKEYCFTGDVEANHGEADNALKLFLLELGYKDLVDEWEKVKKWYA